MAYENGDRYIGVEAAGDLPSALDYFTEAIEK